MPSKKLTFEFMKDTLERIAAEYPSVCQCRCHCKGANSACSSCEITFLLSEFQELADSDSLLDQLARRDNQARQDNHVPDVLRQPR